MGFRKGTILAVSALLILAVAGCGRIPNPFRSNDDRAGDSAVEDALEREGTFDTITNRDVFRESRSQRRGVEALNAERKQESFFDLFTNQDDPNITLEVNKYIWNATLDVLDFLPIQSADPFSGVLVFGYGTPPGGGRAYRATVFIQDPALDARSLRVALASRGGAASLETTRAVEDAILTRARQLRLREGDL